MPSSKEYLHFILEQLSDLDDISYRPMMGEFILYYHGKIVGGIYDDRLLVKKTGSALELMPAAICELPYEGAKEMLLVDEVDNKEFLTELFEVMHDELPMPKQKKQRKTEIGRQFEYNTYIRDFFADNPGKSLHDAIKCWNYKKSLPGHHRYEQSDLCALDLQILQNS